MGVEVNPAAQLIFALSAHSAASRVLNTFNFSTIAPGGFGFDSDWRRSPWRWSAASGPARRGDRRPHRRLVPPGFTFVGSYKAIVYGVLVILGGAYEPGGVLGLLQRGVEPLRRSSRNAARGR